jgi:metal-responsive CopG/Arc/MetJ family transcriptional regulator
MNNKLKPGKEKKPKISVSVNSDLNELLTEHLDQNNINRSKYIEDLIRKDLKNRGFEIKDKF